MSDSTNDWEIVSKDSDSEFEVVDHLHQKPPKPVKEEATRAKTEVEVDVDDSSVLAIKVNSMGWITVDASKEIDKAVLVRLKRDRDRNEVKKYTTPRKIDEPLGKQSFEPGSAVIDAMIVTDTDTDLPVGPKAEETVRLACTFAKERCLVVQRLGSSQCSEPPSFMITCTAETPQKALRTLALAIVARQKKHSNDHKMMMVAQLERQAHQGKGNNNADSEEGEYKKAKEKLEKIDSNLNKLEDELKAKDGLTSLPESVRNLLNGFDKTGTKVLIRNRLV